MALDLADLISSFQIKGAQAPVADVVDGTGRSLDLAGTTSTPPRAISSRGVRGAEFRSSSFSASTPQAFACATGTGLNSSLYVSGKIQSFTWLARFRPNKSGLTALALTPLGGLFSDSNMGATARVYDQPCFVFIESAAGSSRVVVSVMGAILDTKIATQDLGPTEDEPSEDAAWQTIGVIVTGDSGTNNTLSSARLIHVTADGTRRGYTLGAHRSGARVLFTTNPSNNDTLTINGRAYTFKTALAGTAATASVQGLAATQPADGYTITVGSKTYTFKNSVSAAAKASGTITFNSAKTLAKSDKVVELVVGGYVLKLSFSTKNVSGQPAGYVQNVGTSIDELANRVHRVIHGDWDGDKTKLQIPAPPTSGTNSGKDWSLASVNARDFSTQLTSYVAGSYVVTIEAIVAGTAGNSITLSYTDPNTTKVISSVSGATLSGGTNAPTAYSVKIGATASDTATNFCKALLGTGTGGTHYSTDVVANSIVGNAVVSGNDVNLTSALLGTAGNGQVLSQSGATYTLVAWAGGTSGSDADHVLIEATAAGTYANLVDALNLTGSKGLDYGSPTTINADVTASVLGSGILLLTAKASGTSGNSVTLSTTVSGTTFKDEFGDKTATTLVGGTGAPPFTVAAGARPDNADLQILVGGVVDSFTTTLGAFMGAVSDVALADRALTVDEIAAWGFQPPAASTRDRGWYRGAHRVRLAVKAAETAAWHVPVPLAEGVFNPRAEMQRYGSRHAIRLYSVGGAGRPMQCNALAFSYQREGGLTSAARGGYFRFPEFVGGMSPNAPKPSVPRDTAYDLVNMSLHQGILRTRRGYRILAQAGTDVSGTPCAFYDATNAAGETYHLYFAGGTIYLYDNGNLESADTGWPANELPTVATIGRKTFFLSSTRKRVFIDGTFSDVGVTAPTSSPLFVSSTPASGAPVATAPGYEYVVTFYDGTKLTDSGPSPSVTVVLPPGTPASTITLGIPVAASSDVTMRRVWRRRIGDTNRTFLLVGEVEDNTTTTFDDESEQPLLETLEDYAGFAVTAEFPEGTACAAVDGRLAVWGLTDNRQIAVSELGDGERYWAGSIVTCDGAVRSVVPHEGRFLVFTDRTVEVIEGDFLRSASGLLGITRRVLDTSKGVFGPYAATVAGSRVFWADASGVHTMMAGTMQRDVAQDVAWPVRNLVQSAVDTLGTNVVLEYDYVSGQLWCCMSQADATDATKNRVVLVLDLARRKWTVFDHRLSHIARVRDGIYGYLFVGCDYYGNVLELDVYDADGVQGNESWLTGIVATGAFSSCSVSGKTVTFSGASLPTDGYGLRGVSVVFEDVSAGTFHRATILSNTATVVTFDEVPSALVVGDRCYIGQILGMMETPEEDAGTLDFKVMREVAVGLVDAAHGAY